MSTAQISKQKNVDILYSRLKREYPDILEKELRRIDALLSLNRVQGTVKPNTITMKEIVNEVNEVRAKRYAGNKSSPLVLRSV
jgi:phosphoenolpyruvate synthase/pyruvate phosphate dikinase